MEQVCKICGKVYKRVGCHINGAHHISAEEYFIKYVNTDKDAGKCVVCGKPTAF